MLADAKSHRDNVRNLKLTKMRNGLSANSWLAVVGVGETTRQSVRVDTAAGGRKRFSLDVDKGKKKVTETGDGTVPLRGAIPAVLAGGETGCGG